MTLRVVLGQEKSECLLSSSRLSREEAGGDTHVECLFRLRWNVLENQSWIPESRACAVLQASVPARSRDGQWGGSPTLASRIPPSRLVTVPRGPSAHSCRVPFCLCVDNPVDRRVWGMGSWVACPGAARGTQQSLIPVESRGTDSGGGEGDLRGASSPGAQVPLSVPRPYRGPEPRLRRASLRDPDGLRPVFPGWGGVRSSPHPAKALRVISGHSGEERAASESFSSCQIRHRRESLHVSHRSWKATGLRCHTRRGRSSLSVLRASPQDATALCCF